MEVPEVQKMKTVLKTKPFDGNILTEIQSYELQRNDRENLVPILPMQEILRRIKAVIQILIPQLKIKTKIRLLIIVPKVMENYKE